MIDRQELIAVLGRFDVRPPAQSGRDRFAFREELADAILALDKPGAPAQPVTDTGTLFQQAEYANGFHYPAFGISHRLTECNRMGCGPKL